mgnify:CR=1 FL=1
MRVSQCTPIIKPSDSICNLSCAYCYMQGIMKGESVSSFMSIDTLRTLINFFCRDQPAVEFIWHGGEPLVVGIDFYRNVVEFQKTWLQKGVEIKNSMQTNATLVTAEWASFLRENNFSVGVSLDGPQEVHDLMRHYAGGRGSYIEVMRGIGLLREAGIFNGISCCVSSVNCGDPKGLLDFFISQGMKSIKFLRVRGLDGRGNLYPGSISLDEYSAFLISIFYRWLELDDPEIEVRDIKSIVELLLGGDFRECVYMGKCYNFVTVYGDGSIYGCDALPRRDSLYFGNVKNHEGENLNFSKFIGIVESQKDACKSCELFNICRGGCLQDRVPNIFSGESKNSACQNIKDLCGEIASVLDKYGLAPTTCARNK